MSRLPLSPLGWENRWTKKRGKEYIHSWLKVRARRKGSPRSWASPVWEKKQKAALGGEIKAAPFTDAQHCTLCIPQGPGNSVARRSPVPFRVPRAPGEGGVTEHPGPASCPSLCSPAACPVPRVFPGSLAASCLARVLHAPRECCASIQQPAGPPLKCFIVQLAGLREPGYVEAALL